MSADSSDLRGAKRKFNDKKKYFSAKRKRSNHLEPGVTGFLVTCNYNEKRCLNECYDLLNHYADKLGLVNRTEEDLRDHDSGDEIEEDFDAAFAKEVEGIKSKTTMKERDFQQVTTGIKNVLFIRTKLGATGNLSIMDAILDDIKSGVKRGSRNIMRMMPIIGTCKVDQDKLNQLASQCLVPFLGTVKITSQVDDQVTNAKDDSLDGPDELDKNGKSDVGNEDVDEAVGNEDVDDAVKKESSPAVPASPPPTRTFNVDFKARHNGSLDRHTTLRQVSNVVQGLDDRNRVDYDDPHFTIAVEILGKTACLALLKQYKANKKYNLQMFGGGDAVSEGKGDRRTEDNEGVLKVEKDSEKEESVETREGMSEKKGDDATKEGEKSKDEFGFFKPAVGGGTDNVEQCPPKEEGET